MNSWSENEFPLKRDVEGNMLQHVSVVRHRIHSVDLSDTEFIRRINQAPGTSGGAVRHHYFACLLPAAKFIRRVL
jgi:hypothetical protein